jgi:3',5'-cyclic AMP phosphodiesterase CpdA
MSVVLQVSDTHFGTEQPLVLEALVALSADLQPTLVVLSGDITQRARSVQFSAARRFTSRLGAPLLAVPGNHDIPLVDLWSRFTRPYARYRAAFGSDLEPQHEVDDLLVLGVNTTRAWRHVQGHIGARQIERVAARLAQARPAQLRVVVVHQPLDVARPEERRHRLQGHGEASQRWSAAGADLVLGGHIHLPYVMSVAGLARPLWVVQAGTAVSHRVRPGVPNSVNVLRWGADAAPGVCAVEQWDFDAGSQSFARVRATPLRVDRSPV